MLVNDIFDIARDQTYTLETDLSDADLLKYLNLVYRGVISSITDLEEYFYWQRYTADTVVDQSEYSIPTDGEKVFKVFIKYNSDYDFVECEYVGDENTYKDDTYLKANASEKSPKYNIKDNSLFVYPSVNTVVSDGLKIHATSIPEDLGVGGAEATIDLKPKYHDILWLGMVPLIFSRLGMFNEMRLSQQNFEARKEQMLKEMVPRKPTPMYENNVDLTLYE